MNVTVQVDYSEFSRKFQQLRASHVGGVKIGIESITLRLFDFPYDISTERALRFLESEGYLPARADEMGALVTQTNLQEQYTLVGLGTLITNPFPNEESLVFVFMLNHLRQRTMGIVPAYSTVWKCGTRIVGVRVNKSAHSAAA